MSKIDVMRWALLAAACLVLAACRQQDDARSVPVDMTPNWLSEWQLLERQGSELMLRDDSIAYDLNTPLFSDYARKLRTVWMPEGASARVNADGVLEFPEGTVITKTFYYPDAGGRMTTSGIGAFDGRALDVDAVRLVETRLLVRRSDGWEALPYVWDDAEQDAELSPAGDIKRLMLEHEGNLMEFPYVVPTKTECASCHAWDHTAADIRPIGPKVRHLDKSSTWADGSQLNVWMDRGMLAPVDLSTFAQAAAWPPRPGADIEHAARSYLDINCGHCHNPVGPADTSGLFLHYEETSLRRLGACKQPVAAGRGSGGRAVSIAPGDPDASILYFRMQSTDPAQMMPELGRALVHKEGVDLIGRWIRALEGECVQSNSL
ncbi:MAG: SO2930 family diheme c-type cytochrome [Gammaproteobacteria bacterium]|nr:SO2930 family diheme c-type cytochrome [Gammaproteobacteria bacterium]